MQLDVRRMPDLCKASLERLVALPQQCFEVTGQKFMQISSVGERFSPNLPSTQTQARAQVIPTPAVHPP
ncbi:predicted protein [Plenodomus lingam JN3]|uniref:Predicted protein n=1 Tax=Leptosphaeria maculans (strain JN3 / isolate v23.1.3 / race Av1-4-5-6-7-8) TaxID=985895 RepID=E4ZS03_LEPMJ|nr:predicted protein [Plenodomus lingam JN3]CBX94183.1 predicted protein [Plenodomus lingam JN3]